MKCESSLINSDLQISNINGAQLLIVLGGIPNYGPGQVPKDANFSAIKMVCTHASTHTK